MLGSAFLYVVLAVLADTTTPTPTFSSVVSVIFPILTVVTGGVAILAYGSNKVLRDTSNDLRQRVGDLETEREIDRQKMNSQAAELAVWQRAVTGEVQLSAILDLLGDHHREAVLEWTKNRVAQGEMSQALNDLSRHIKQRFE